jgi:glutathione S-transferase
VDDGNVIVESSLILYYIDEAFPDPPLMPKKPVARHRVRLYNKLIDEYLHNACTIMTFATAFRPRFLKMSREQWLAEINKAPLKRRAEYKRSVIEHGLDSEFVVDALGQHQKMISWMAEDLRRGPYLAGDAFSNADCAVIPYILHPASRTSQARLYVAARTGRGRLVGASARARLGQVVDLRPHGGGRLGAV